MLGMSDGIDSISASFCITAWNRTSPLIKHLICPKYQGGLLLELLAASEKLKYFKKNVESTKYHQPPPNYSEINNIEKDSNHQPQDG